MHQLNDDIQLPINLDPLVEAIRKNKSVVYVGAGASKSAGLPDWESFLKECLLKAEKSYFKNSSKPIKKKKFDLASSLLNKGEYLMAAELLQQEIGTTLSSYIWDIFGTKRTPSQIHKAIARIPFSLAITTNYDKLLEAAYSKIPNVFTWLDPHAIFSALKDDRFAVIKTHGDVGNDPSVVLTKTHYRNLMNLNRAFNEEFITILSLKTFLFIGSSLRDTDLLRLMDEAKLTYGDNFGPHYAFLFEEEVDENFIRYLRNAYNIHVIVSKASNEYKTDSVCSFLKVLSGRVSELEYENLESKDVNSDLFCFNKLVLTHLQDILRQTGADKCTAAFIDNRDIHRLKYYFKQSIYNEENKIILSESETDCLDEIGFLNIIKEFYSKGSKAHRFVYYPNVIKENHNAETDVKGWKCCVKIKQDTVKSIVLTNIISDGQTVGVILLESSILDAFTNDHLKTLQKSTSFLSSTFKELELRTNALQEFDVEKNASKFQDFMDTSYLLKGQNLLYLLYKIDNRNGRVIAYYNKEKFIKEIEGFELNPNNVEAFEYFFEENSLATHVLNNQKGIYLIDVDKFIIGKSEDGIISEKGIEKFKIKGEIFATPIRVGKYNSFICVVWSSSFSNKNLKNLILNKLPPHISSIPHSTTSKLVKSRVDKNEGTAENIMPLPLNSLADNIYRLAHLIANSIEGINNKILDEDNKAYKFINYVNKGLEPFDRNKPWGIKTIKLKEDKNDVKDDLYKVLIKELTRTDTSNIARLRVWFYDENNRKNTKFICIHSFTREDAVESENPEIDKYIGQETSSFDEYCKFNLERFQENPYSMHQHMKMFRLKDDNSEKLDKDPNGKWIVGPITFMKNDKSECELLGYISADNHFKIKNIPKEIVLSEKEDAFQRYSIDLVTDLIVPVLRLYKYNSWKKFNDEA